MITTYEIIDGIWTGGTRDIGEADPVYDGWTRAAPPELTEGGVVKWLGNGWVALTAAQWLEERKFARLEALAERRWQAETGGIIVAGLEVKTDADTQRKITGAYVKADKSADFTVSWKVATGVFITLDAPTILAIGDAATAHIQACFDKEAALTAQILAAADLAALDAVDIEAGWPG